MHPGDIHNSETKAGQVFKYLKSRPGEWVDSWSLQMATRSTAISTRISEIRHQLRGRSDVQVESCREGKKWFYRVVTGPPVQAGFEF